MPRKQVKVIVVDEFQQTFKIVARNMKEAVNLLDKKFLGGGR